MSDKSTASQSEIRDLVARLADFSSRGRARTRLVMIGLDATDALIEALKSPLEGIAWAAARTLGDIKAVAALDALQEAVADPRLKTVATEAIAAISGGDAPASQAPAARLDDAGFASMLVSENVDVTKGASGYLCSVKLPGGRRQKVDVLLSIKDPDGAPLVALYTECGPASPDRYEWALKTNLKTPFGAFAVRQTSEGSQFVMVDAYLRQGLTAQQLTKSVESLAKRADSLERTLTGEDVK